MGWHQSATYREYTPGALSFEYTQTEFNDFENWLMSAEYPFTWPGTDRVVIYLDYIVRLWKSSGDWVPLQWEHLNVWRFDV